MRRNTSTVAGRAALVARRTHAIRTSAVVTILIFLLGAAPTRATDLKPQTLQAWNGYVEIVNSTTDRRATGGSQFLAVDETADMVQRVRGGELVVTNHDPREVPHGLIHHWLGVMFLPNVTLDQVMAVLVNYDHYGDYYKPFIAKSSVMERSGDQEKVNMMMVQKAYSVTAAVDADYQVQIVRLDANRVYIVSNAIRVQEVADYGEPSQHLYPENERPGYVWRTMGLTRLEQRDGGVYVEMETIALSRGIPVAFRWLVKPLTDKLPRKIMMATLEATRAAVNGGSAPVPNSDQNVAESAPHR
jgi:hypothetical protein